MTCIRQTNFFLAAIASALAAATTSSVVDAFVAPAPIAQRTVFTTSSLHESADDINEEQTIESYLQENYPLFESLLLSQIPDIYSTFKAGGGCTIFAPSNSVMEGIDPKRKVQVSDPRNVEVTEKLAAYHVIPTGKVSWERLKREDWTVPKVDGVAALSIGGVLTLGGELRVGRSKSGGFMGWYAKEDGGVVIGNNEARVVKSTSVANCVIHEVDGFVAPDLIWRYFDQLRIPGF